MKAARDIHRQTGIEKSHYEIFLPMTRLNLLVLSLWVTTRIRAICQARDIKYRVFLSLILLQPYRTNYQCCPESIHHQQSLQQLLVADRFFQILTNLKKKWKCYLSSILNYKKILLSVRQASPLRLPLSSASSPPTPLPLDTDCTGTNTGGHSRPMRPVTHHRTSLYLYANSRLLAHTRGLCV